MVKDKMKRIEKKRKERNGKEWKRMEMNRKS
jgi:hypothetical protein